MDEQVDKMDRDMDSEKHTDMQAEWEYTIVEPRKESRAVWIAKVLYIIQGERTFPSLRTIPPPDNSPSDNSPSDNSSSRFE